MKWAGDEKIETNLNKCQYVLSSCDSIRRLKCTHIL
jgi:hypothetical protein